MAEFPALPFFTDAYLADTRHLTTEEHGAYLLLLMCAWRTRGCLLRDDDRQLARIAGMSPTRWRRIRPVMVDFFAVEGGHWRQKKLLTVYETVAKKVERSRANGSKGGRATAARQKVTVTAGSGRFTPGWSIGDDSEPDQTASEQGAGACDVTQTMTDAAANDTATKTKAKTKSSSSGRIKTEDTSAGHGDADPEAVPSSGQRTPDGAREESAGETPIETITGSSGETLQQVAAAAGLDALFMDKSALEGWQAAGADVAADILPTVRRLAERELKRTGKTPAHLAYYTGAILEARDRRVGALKAGAAHKAARPAASELVAFDRTRADHWRRFLGDPASRFRGDYLSQNWRVPSGHPEFHPAGLGPDPKHRFNPMIPAEIYAAYGPAWHWQVPPEESQQDKG